MPGSIVTYDLANFKSSFLQSAKTPAPHPVAFWVSWGVLRGLPLLFCPNDIFQFTEKWEVISRGIFLIFFLNNMYSIFFAFLTGIKIVMHPADKRGKLLGIRLPGFV